MRRPLLVYILALVLVLIPVAGCGSSTSTQSTSKKLVVDSWGGWYESQESKDEFQPFARQTGINVVALSDGENMLAKVKTQVATGRGDIDVIHADVSWLNEAEQQGLLAKIDYNTVQTSRLYQDIVEPYGVGILYWSFNPIYNTQVFPNGHPSTWADVWQYAINHPGRVAMWSGAPDYNLEVALMAAGYSINQVYPLTAKKIKDAYVSLDKIKKKVKWYTTGDQAIKLFSDGDVDLGMGYAGDIAALIVKGAHLGIEWNQAIYTQDYWLVVKNAPHLQNAMKFINFTLTASVQAQLAEDTYYAPVNKDAFAHIHNQQLAKDFASYPQNKAMELDYDFQWWGINNVPMGQQWNNWLRG